MHIRQAEAKEIPVLSGVMARAFSKDKLNLWIFKDEKRAVENGQKLFSLMFHRFMDEGFCLTTDDGKAVILCVPPSAKSSISRDIALMLRMIPILKTRMFFMIRMFKRIEALKPKAPHFYIEHLGVDPATQRDGLGTALLNYVLGVCDRNGWMAYLELLAHLAPYYERFGFEVRKRCEIPEAGITLCSMVRDKQEDLP